LLFGVRTFLGVLLQRGDPGDSSRSKDTADEAAQAIVFYALKVLKINHLP